jgi:hypothetical protein
MSMFVTHKKTEGDVGWMFFWGGLTEVKVRVFL